MGIISYKLKKQIIGYHEVYWTSFNMFCHGLKVFLYIVKMSSTNNIIVPTMVNVISIILNLNICSSQVRKTSYYLFDFLKITI